MPTVAGSFAKGGRIKLETLECSGRLDRRRAGEAAAAGEAARRQTRWAVSTSPPRTRTLSRASMVALQAAVLGGSSSGVTGGKQQRRGARAGQAPSRSRPCRRRVIDYAISGTTTTVLDDRDGSGAAQPTAGDLATITPTTAPGWRARSGERHHRRDLHAGPARDPAGHHRRQRDDHRSAHPDEQCTSVTARGGFAMTLRIDGLTAGLRVAVPGSGIRDGHHHAAVQRHGDAARRLCARLGLRWRRPPAPRPRPAGRSGRAWRPATCSSPLQPFVQYDVDAYPRSGQFRAVGQNRLAAGPRVVDVGHCAISAAHLARAAEGGAPSRGRSRGSHSGMRAISTACARFAAVQRAQQLLDAGAVLADQRALGLALLGAAEGSKRRRAGPSGFASRPKRRCASRARGFLTSSPLVVGRRSGGARWWPSLTSPSNMPAIFAVKAGRCAGAPPRTRPCRPSAKGSAPPPRRRVPAQRASAARTFSTIKARYCAA